MKNIEKTKNEEKETDDYLIELMGLKSDFPEEAMEAYGIIYDRYWDSMLRIAEGVTKDSQKAMDLVSDTFNMVYRRAATFKKGKVKKTDNIRLAILSWMTSIMRNIFYDNYLDQAYKDPKFKEQTDESPNIISNVIKTQHFDFYEDDFIDLLEKREEDENAEAGVYEMTESEEEGSENISENLKKISDYLSKISERDRDIILTTYNYYVPGKNTPSKVLDDLESKWSTSRENIRKILQKFRQAIAVNLQVHLRK
ncbi:sigma-70 family RNA polymerase sigma factor [Chryseobacterium indologenes]|uniref:sigma-70 family RNA polymerase sigma factor n=1 Tax=Chryseobacterium indologenes TaxID=253 RepID=UPI001626A8D1|nr:sigma-70 family RNA polymerase sigma factor [Chryseobacterium indologenes]